MFERRLFPEAIIVGMPSELFWDGKPSLFYSYMEAYKLRLEREELAKASTIDYHSWLTGLYVHQAVSVALQNAFSKSKKAKYLSEPVSFTKKKENKMVKKEGEEALLKSQYMAFRGFTETMNGGLKKR